MVAGLLGLGATGLQAVPESLVRNSPFQPEKGAAPAATPQVGRFELRGIFTLDGKARFTVFDTTTNKALWLAVGESEAGIKVAAYDAAAEAVTIECEGQSSRLTMKEAQIVNVAVALPAVAPTTTGGTPPPAVNPGPPANEQEIQERRNRIIEELRRRRALRQANRQQNSPQQ